MDLGKLVVPFNQTFQPLHLLDEWEQNFYLRILIFTHLKDATLYVTSFSSISYS